MLFSEHLPWFKAYAVFDYKDDNDLSFSHACVTSSWTCGTTVGESLVSVVSGHYPLKPCFLIV